MPRLLPPDGRLAGRIAICGGGDDITCKGPTDSSTELPFFEYRGEGSFAAQLCRCGRTRTAHESGRVNDHIYRARGALETDLYYCGHKGWD